MQTIIAMPFALAGEDCETVVIESQGVEHRIAFATDPIRQTPKPVIERRASLVKNGTRLTVLWPDSASSILDGAKRDFLQLADTFTWLNPHLSLSLTWNGERVFEAERDLAGLDTLAAERADLRALVQRRNPAAPDRG